MLVPQVLHLCLLFILLIVVLKVASITELGSSEVWEYEVDHVVYFPGDIDMPDFNLI